MYMEKHDAHFTWYILIFLNVTSLVNVAVSKFYIKMCLLHTLQRKMWNKCPSELGCIYMIFFHWRWVTTRVTSCLIVLYTLYWTYVIIITGKAHIYCILFIKFWSLTTISVKILYLYTHGCVVMYFSHSFYNNTYLITGPQLSLKNRYFFFKTYKLLNLKDVRRKIK